QGGDLLADLDGVLHVLESVVTEPLLNRDPIVAHDHERIVQIPNDPRRLGLEDGVQALHDLGLRLVVRHARPPRLAVTTSRSLCLWNDFFRDGRPPPGRRWPAATAPRRHRSRSP